MSALAHSKVLVLNKSWTPVNIYSMEDAIVKLSSDGGTKARVIEPETYIPHTWEAWTKLRPQPGESFIRTPSMTIRVPEVIVLSKYEKVPNPKRACSRKRIYQRDNYQCMYCNDKLSSEELTIDHIIPRSQGGTTTWENCVLACFDCNMKKRNRTPEQAGMKLLTVPKAPKPGALFRYDLKKPIKSWEAFLGESYWNIPLEP